MPGEEMPHKVWLLPDGLGGVDIAVECPGADVGGCQVYSERVMNDGDPCACVLDDCPCRDGHHSDCDDPPYPYVHALVGPPCCYEVVPGCGIYGGDWFHEMGMEMFHGGPWPKQAPILVGVEWDDDGPRLTPWPAAEVPDP